MEKRVGSGAAAPPPEDEPLNAKRPAVRVFRYPLWKIRGVFDSGVAAGDGWEPGRVSQLSSRRRSSQRSSKLLMNELLGLVLPGFPLLALPKAAPRNVAK